MTRQRHDLPAVLAAITCELCGRPGDLHLVDGELLDYGLCARCLEGIARAVSMLTPRPVVVIPGQLSVLEYASTPTGCEDEE